MSEVDRMSNIEHWPKCEALKTTLDTAHRDWRAEVERLTEQRNRAIGETFAANVQLQGAVGALEAADRLAEAVERWDSHVTLEGLTGTYRAARSTTGGQS